MISDALLQETADNICRRFNATLMRNAFATVWAAQTPELRNAMRAAWRDIAREEIEMMVDREADRVWAEGGDPTE